MPEPTRLSFAAILRARSFEALKSAATIKEGLNALRGFQFFRFLFFFCSSFLVLVLYLHQSTQHIKGVNDQSRIIGLLITPLYLMRIAV
jgi:hypothetical protein